MSAADLRAVAEVDVSQPLPADVLMSTLVSPPFIYVQGTFNTRDLGLVPVSSGSSNVRKSYAYRSGALGGLTDDGKALVARKLGVKRIFDLRSAREHAQGPDPAIDGVQNVWRESAEKDAVVDLSEFVEGQGEKGYERMYLEVLDVYRLNFKDVLEHVRDCPDEPFLFHCTAGRDRTGVLAGLLLTLAGADPETIGLDFILSRVGTEPAREQLISFAKHGAGVESDDAPGFHNLCNLKTACWNAFLDGVSREYGGFEGFITKELGFTEQDLATIKANLTVPN